MKGIIFAAVSAATFMASAANATVYNLNASGIVSSTTLAVNGVYTPAPAGQFKVGDAFNLTMRFDTDKAILTSLFDADPTINIYYLPDLVTTIAAGSYRSVYSPRYDFDGSLQLWNNFISVGPTDSQSFSSFHYDFNGATPFDLGGGLNSELVTLNAFDFSSLVRNSDLISELVGSSRAFGSNSFSYSYSAGPTPDLNVVRPAVLVDVGSVSWTLTPFTAAVPEPATWAMMILGMGAVGFAMRRRKQTVRVVFAQA
ncbi:PEPxxWA-CTERM sorting domain-containing protein [Sphingomonas beigongshangi]|uniref:PEPxxWA-CTERM sorting domain-containing protein n=1 Tax=Sphingomonas beigongshangi TaxID=2782540 RepID=UPI001EED3FC1|nr:PEPxxWA-CTERM sorting domain-containing protein [Sphingomonas beigongshangi]